MDYTDEKKKRSPTDYVCARSRNGPERGKGKNANWSNDLRFGRWHSAKFAVAY